MIYEFFVVGTVWFWMLLLLAVYYGQRPGVRMGCATR